MLSRSLVSAILLTGLAALAQDNGPDFDADLPDASVGTGGADQNSQEKGDERTNAVCAAARDCEPGFTCNHGKCAYAGYRVATYGGCGGGAIALVLPGMLWWRARRRREQ